MGMNYYIEYRIADLDVVKEHIGKKSARWDFVFYSPHPDIKTATSWLEHLSDLIERDNCYIVNELGERTPLDYFWEGVVMSERDGQNLFTDFYADNTKGDTHSGDVWIDSDGFAFTGKEFS